MDKKELIKNTLDMKFYKRGLITVSVLTPIVILLFVLALFSPEIGIISLPILLILIFYIPMIAYYIYKIKSIISEPDRYDIYDATAKTPHMAWGMGRGRMYFDIEVNDNCGGVFYLETHGVFSRSVISSAYYGNYAQQTIKVLYDRTTGTLLVLDKQER